MKEKIITTKKKISFPSLLLLGRSDEEATWTGLKKLCSCTLDLRTKSSFERFIN
jgi:hypothetical protein